MPSVSVSVENEEFERDYLKRLSCTPDEVERVLPREPCRECGGFVYRASVRRGNSQHDWAEWSCAACGADVIIRSGSVVGPEEAAFLRLGFSDDKIEDIKSVAAARGISLVEAYGAIKDEEVERAKSQFPPPESCPKCAETTWLLLSTSPNEKSATWQCEYCGRSETVKRIEHWLGSPAVRTTIPKEVQRDVWRRDNGRCVECGSNERIELDHIIPLSKGGSNTARNIQLLCEICNRRKGNSNPGDY